MGIHFLVLVCEADWEISLLRLSLDTGPLGSFLCSCVVVRARTWPTRFRDLPAGEFGLCRPHDSRPENLRLDKFQVIVVVLGIRDLSS